MSESGRGREVPSSGQEPLRDTLWAAMEPVFKGVLAHPFVLGLTDGSLPKAAFRYYVVQDAHYLRDYARALAAVAVKAPDEPTIAMFATHAAGAIEVERSLHAGFFPELGTSVRDALAEPVMPTTLAYTSYLLRATHQGGFTEGLAAVLPCYWIYAEVGQALAGRSSPDPLYARWIETYGGDEFGAIVAAVLDVVDAVGATVSTGQVEAMVEQVSVTARYEWMFWDAAWRGENWPI